MKQQILIDALEDIKEWNENLEEIWGDPGSRAVAAIRQFHQSKEQEGDMQWVSELKELWQDIDLIIDYTDFDEVQKYKMIKEKVHSFNKKIKP